MSRSYRTCDRREREGQLGVPDTELLAIGYLGIAGRLRLAAAVRQHQVPVGRREQDAGAKPPLELLRTAVVVTVPVAHEHVRDVGRIEPERPQPLDNFRLDVVVIQRVDDDDAPGGRDRPGVERPRAEEVEVVEHLGRIGIPLRLRRRLAPGWGRRWPARGRPRCGTLRGTAQIVEETGVLGAGSLTRCGDRQLFRDHGLSLRTPEPAATHLMAGIMPVVW